MVKPVHVLVNRQYACHLPTHTHKPENKILSSKVPVVTTVSPTIENQRNVLVWLRKGFVFRKRFENGVKVVEAALCIFSWPISGHKAQFRKGKVNNSYQRSLAEAQDTRNILSFDVAQGSVLVPVLFRLYIQPLFELVID